MKKCTKCEQVKPPEMFNRNHERKDGRREQCKECTKAHSKTPAGIASRLKYYHSDKGKAARLRNKPPLAVQRERTKIYRQSESGKAKCKAYDDKFKDEHPDRVRAITAVMHAIQRSKITRPKHCSHCGKKRKVQGHHESYEPKQWLRVVWLCASCHKNLHLGNITLLNSPHLPQPL